jgi:SAM-dependent methyltransferase
VAWLESTPDRFDVVFGSYGCLPWLEDLPRFFRGVQRVLVADGLACFLEFHPLVWSFDEAFRFSRDSYFASGPFSDPVGDYVGAAAGALSPSGYVDTGPAPNPHPAHAWQHTVADVVNAAIDAGLVLERIVELPWSNGCKVCPGLVRSGRRFVAPQGQPSPPLLFGMRARRSR